MKTKISLLVIASLVGLSTPAQADVYVKVDANGNAIGGAIVCDAATCGAGSLYSQLTLQPGESYQLQGYGHSGIGNNNPGVEVKVDISTQTWSITNNNAPEPTVTTFVPSREPDPVAPPAPVVTDTATVISETTTATVDTATATIETTTATSLEIRQLNAKIARLEALIARIQELLKGLFGWL
jgi:hypothetical protein